VNHDRETHVSSVKSLTSQFNAPSIIQPKKSLIIYLEGQSSQIFDSPSIQRLVQEGCSGILYPRSVNSKSELQSTEKIVQLLGRYDDFYDDEGKPIAKTLKTNNSQKLGFLTNDTHVFEFVKNLEIPTFHLEPTNDLYEKISFFLGLSQEKLTGFEIDILFLHLNSPTFGESLEKSLSKIYEQFQQDIFFVLVADQLVTQSQTEVVTEGLDERLVACRPLQSYELKKSKRLPNILRSECFLVSYFHANSTRRDEVSRFEYSEIVQKGCLLENLADYFLAEISYKVGHAPKYGA